MTYLYLKPITWTQSIRRYPTIDVNGLYLTTQCRTDSDLILSDKLKLSDLEISLSFLRGAVPEKDQEKAKLAEGAIGGIWWLSDHNFVHGSIYLPEQRARTYLFDLPEILLGLSGLFGAVSGLGSARLCDAQNMGG